MNTVLGEITPEHLGTTLVHEHMFLDSTIWAVEPDDSRYKRIFHEPVKLDNVGLVRRAGLYSIDNLLVDDFDMIADELNAFKSNGGSTVVDVTVEGIGRNVDGLRKLSALSGTNIIASTGYYVDKTIPPEIKKSSVPEITDRLVRELTEGIGSSVVKAGVIGEIGVSPGGMTDNERKILVASAKAQSKTGVPITVHMWGDPPEKWPGFQVIDILESNDADLSKVYLSHIDWTYSQKGNWSIARKAGDRGVYLSFDNFGNEWPASTLYSKNSGLDVFGAPTDLERINGIQELVKNGLEDRILFAHDLCQKIHFKKYGGHGLEHLLINVPRLFEALGYDSSLVRKCLVVNSRKLFS